MTIRNLRSVRNALVCAAMCIGLCACASSYREEVEGEPYGYSESALSSGEISVTYKTWKKWSDEKLCEYAKRRVVELVGESAAVTGPTLQSKVEIHRTDAVNGKTGVGLQHGNIPTMLIPEYTSTFTVRSCTWVARAQ